MGGGGKGGGNQTTGYRYFMDVHMGVYRGPLNHIRKIRVGGRDAWVGMITANDVVEIDEPKLFGGDKSEGGIKGDLHVWMGAKTQVLDPDIKNNISDPCPDFRGITTLYYSGQISANNPYPKEWEIYAGRTTAGWDNDTPWYPEKATIELQGDLPDDEDDPEIVYAMNPAHMIYEAFTNRSWGKGWPASFLDDVAFRAVADKLYDEKFGLCLKWNRQDKISEFIKQVIDHIAAGVWVDRGSGLITIGLIRDDYDADTIPLFDYNSGLLEIRDDDKSAPSTVVNELIVRYRNPVSNLDNEVRVQNLGSIQSTGKTTSTVEYPGLPVASLAHRVAQRDGRIFAYGLRRYTLVMDRRAWRLAPTKVIRIRDEQQGLLNIVLRVATLEDKLDDDGDGTIIIEAVQDVFGLPATSFVHRQPGTWRPPVTTPVGSSFRDVQESSYRDLAHVLGSADLSAITEDQGAVMTVAAKPANLALNYAIWTKTGAEQYIQRGVADWCPTGVLSAPVGTYETTFVLEDMIGVTTESVEIGQALFCGSEIMKLVARVGSTLTVDRGCADTLPVPHSAGSRIWLYDRYAGTDNREYVSSEIVSVKLLTHTSTGDQVLGTAPTDTVTMNRRQIRPYPPGDLRLNTTPYDNVVQIKGDITFAWAHRDRLSQDDALIGHGEGSIGPEVGTTYTLRIYNGVTLLRTQAGISGTGFVYTYIMAEVDGWVPNPTFELEAVRDTFVSLQKYHKTINHVPLGPFRPIISTLSGEVGSTNPFISGTADAASSVQVYVGVFPAGVANGSPVIADGSGNWSKTLVGLASGANNVYAVASNVDGPSPPSLSKTLTVVWYNPSAALSIDFKGNRFRLNGVETLNATDADWTGLFNNTLTSTAQILRKTNGDLIYVVANKLPRVPGEGLRHWAARTNRLTNLNAQITATTNLSVTSGTATITVAADATALSTGKFADVSMATAMNGNCLRFSNTGLTAATLLIGGTTNSTSSCSFSVYTKGDAVQFETNNVAPQVLGTAPTRTAYDRFESVFTPGAISDQIVMRLGAGLTVDFVLDTLEQGGTPSDPIINPTAAGATRAVSNIRRTLAGEFNAVEGFIRAIFTRVPGYTTIGNAVHILEPDTANSHVVGFNSTNVIRGATLVSGSTTAQLTSNYVAKTQAVYGYKLNDFGYSADGSVAATDILGALPAGPAVLMVGSSASPLNGLIERVDLGILKPSNAEIQRMSNWISL
jgi:hypothetical protein